MSGLLERIVRRRRAPASSRLGPPSQDGSPSVSQLPDANGGAPETTTHVNGWVPAHAGDAERVTKPEDVTEPADADPEGVTEPEADAEPEGVTEPESDPRPSEPDFRERGRIRRRARYLRRLREIQMRDIGGFMLELHRFGRKRPDLVEAKLTAAAKTDSELRTLERALGDGQTLRELREPGIGGACGHCGAVHGSEDRFCSTCGEPLTSHVVTLHEDRARKPEQADEGR